MGLWDMSTILENTGRSESHTPRQEKNELECRFPMSEAWNADECGMFCLFIVPVSSLLSSGGSSNERNEETTTKHVTSTEHKDLSVPVFAIAQPLLVAVMVPV